MSSSTPPYGEARSSSSRFLPPDPAVEAPHRLTPGLAVRVGVLGSLTVIVFAVLVLRLLALQVIAGDRHLAVAQGNQLRTVKIDAPRGTIVDRNGKVIVDNIAGTAVKLWVGDLPKEGRYDIVRRLAAVLEVPAGVLAKQVDERRTDPLNPITVKVGVRRDQLNYLMEHQAEFAGVKIQQAFLRDYPLGARAAQILGYVGEISPEELARLGNNYESGDKIGKAGVEAAFDAYLRGEAGEAQVTVDSLGQPQSPLSPKKEARSGSQIRLTIDSKLQQSAEEALRFGIATAKANKSYYADGGAIVAMDPEDGAILAMASNPTYKPSVYVGRINPKKIAPLVDTAVATKENFPGLNRVTQVAYPPGSTWKPVTAIAAMQEHRLSPYESIPCTPTATYGLDKFKFRNWDPYINKPITLTEALARSCDTYFYEVGYRFYTAGQEARSRMQDWATKFGFGLPTGLNLGWEEQGVVPTPAWRKKTFKSDWDRAWNPGDSIQLSIGQKELRVTPLQMARFYAMIANGGRLVTPYLVQSAETPGANGLAPVVQHRFAPRTPVSAGVDPAALQIIRDGLYQATHSSFGTSQGVFGGFPIGIAGKTGTAEEVVQIPGYPAGHTEDQSWWCGFGPTDSQARIVVCAIIENGGHGSTAAAPAALKVFEKFFNVRAGQQTLVGTD